VNVLAFGEQLVQQGKPILRDFEPRREQPHIGVARLALERPEAGTRMNLHDPRPRAGRRRQYDFTSLTWRE
jgi:hypothetical protein